MIALTNGQLRRRWRMRWLTLLTMLTAALPLPQFLLPLSMGFLVKDGKPLIRDGLLRTGTCADCCGGGGCSACKSANNCGFCSGDTPTAWALSFTSVDTAVPCMDCGALGGGNFAMSAGGGSLGTYTGFAQEVGGGFQNCLWAKQTTGPILRTSRSGTLCTPFTSNNQLGLLILKKAASILVLASDAFSSPVLDGCDWFRGEVAASDCCAPFTMPNLSSAYTCNDVSIPNQCYCGKNGTCVGTPCG